MSASDDASEGKTVASGAQTREAGRQDDPQWAESLKRLYDSVVEEPLPDSFKDLLSKLDDAGNK